MEHNAIKWEFTFCDIWANEKFNQENLNFLVR